MKSLRSSAIRNAWRLIAGLAACLLRCGESPAPGPADGTERGNCYPNGTCNAGLTCFSDKCVRYDAGIGASGAGGSSAASGGSGGSAGGAGSGGAPTGGSAGTAGGAGASGAGGAAGSRDGGAGSAGAGGAAGTGGAAGNGGSAGTSGAGGIGGASGAGGTAGDAGAAGAGGTTVDASVDAACADSGGTPDSLTVPSCGTPGTASAKAYSGKVTLVVSGIMQNAPGVFNDPFYALDGNDVTKTTGASPERLVYNRFAEGSCVCPSECPATSHMIADILVSPYPAFNPMHSYVVVADLGAVSDRINFAYGDCGCGDNSGSWSLTISQSTCP